MSSLARPPSIPPIEYPDTDGLPMAENTLQYEWIVTIVTGLRHLFENDPNVFVAGDLFWYPIEGRPKIRVAPDAMVAFGRPAGHRSSYLQWEEGGIAPQVVFEVRSPGNRAREMAGKLAFYARHGVEEYYIVDPDRLRLAGYLRQGGLLIEVERMPGHVSPRLGIQFELADEVLTILRPDGKPFRSAEEIARLEDQERQRADREQGRAEKAIRRAKQERDRADRLQRELDELRRQSAPPRPDDAR
jgi:Uma2 family endonuclease